MTDVTLLEPLLEREWGEEVLAFGTSVAYIWLPDGVIASRLAKAVERALGSVVISRSWSSVVKLGALMSVPRLPDRQD